MYKISYQTSGYSQWWTISLIFGTEKDCSQLSKGLYFHGKKVVPLISISDQYLRISDINLFEYPAKPFSFLSFSWVKMTCCLWVIHKFMLVRTMAFKKNNENVWMPLLNICFSNYHCIIYVLLVCVYSKDVYIS